MLPMVCSREKPMIILVKTDQERIKFLKLPFVTGIFNPHCMVEESTSQRRKRNNTIRTLAMLDMLRILHILFTVHQNPIKQYQCFCLFHR